MKAKMPRKDSINATRKKEWVERGNKIPICINTGCEREVAIRHWSDSQPSLPSLKTECSKCAVHRIRGKTQEGITTIKKKECENSTSVLGFKCPMDPERYAEFPSDCYHMDHKDGNHENNNPDNIITLCSVCHARKGRMSGDFNGSKSTSRKLKKPAEVLIVS